MQKAEAARAGGAGTRLPPARRCRRRRPALGQFGGGSSRARWLIRQAREAPVCPVLPNQGCGFASGCKLGGCAGWEGEGGSSLAHTEPLLSPFPPFLIPQRGGKVFAPAGTGQGMDGSRVCGEESKDEVKKRLVKAGQGTQSQYPCSLLRVTSLKAESRLSARGF